MIYQANITIGGDVEIVVAAQIVVTRKEVVFLAWHHIEFRTAHESVDGYAVFLFAHLVVERAFQRKVFGAENHIGTHQLLVIGLKWLVVPCALHPDIHAQQRNAKHLLGRIIVIPKRLHRLVRLQPARINDTSIIYVVGILVIGCKQVYFVAFALVAQFQHIVGGGGHGPVVVADDTPVVIVQFLTANL